MTVFVTEDLIGSGVQLSDTSTPALSNGQALLVLEGVTVGSGENTAVDLDLLPQFNLTVGGTIFGRASAIESQLYANNDNLVIRIDILETGNILSNNDSAINISPNSSFDVTGSVTITNAGQISAANRAGILSENVPSFTLLNSGQINSRDIDDNISNAVRVFDAFYVNIVNSGLIQNGAIFDDTDNRQTAAISSDIGASSEAGSVMTVFNSGEIIGATHAFYSELETVTLTNTGTINGLIINDGDSGTFDLENSGVISGDILSGRGTANLVSDDVFNGGTIFGEISLQGGDDSVGNSGTITGDVDLGRGDDTYRGSGDGVVVGSVDGGSGQDVMIGSNARDMFVGGSDGDILRGQGGDDVLDGGDDDDMIFGGTGEDELIGGDGLDTLRGGEGNDILFGGDNQDILFGNAGADVFVYTDATDSTDDGNRDLIRDFTNGEDVIDLSAFAGVFTFIGSDSFSGSGGGEIRFVVNAGGNAVVRVDVDGDGNTDMRLLVQGTDTLTENDFFL